MQPGDIRRHPDKNIIIMFKSDENRPGEIVTSSVHRNQVSDFQAGGWMIAPCYHLDIPTPEITEAILREHDKGNIDLIEDSTLRELAAKDAGVRDTLFAMKATKAAIESPDKEKVEEYLETRRGGKWKK